MAKKTDKKKEGKARKADVFAGKGSLADRLRRRRQMMEGDYTAEEMARRHNAQSTDSNNY